MTTYRIRFSREGGNQDEATIEASNPTEAIVKFHHVIAKPGKPLSQRDRVVSVSTDMPGQADFRW